VLHNLLYSVRNAVNHPCFVGVARFKLPLTLFREVSNVQDQRKRKGTVSQRSGVPLNFIALVVNVPTSPSHHQFDLDIICSSSFVDFWFFLTKKVHLR